MGLTLGNDLAGTEGGHSDLTTPFPAAKVEILVDVDGCIARGSGNNARLTDGKNSLDEITTLVNGQASNVGDAIPVYELGNISLGCAGGSTAFFYVRRYVKNLVPLLLDRATVIIKIGGRVRFIGRVISQADDGQRVRYDCEGIEAMINRVPLFGIVDVESGEPDYSYGAVLNERGKRDMLDAATSPSGKEALCDVKGAKPWKFKAAAKYHARLFAGNSGLLGDCEATIGNMENLTDDDILFTQKDYLANLGLFDLVQYYAESADAVAWAEPDAAASVSSPLAEIKVQKIADATAKSITFDSSAGVDSNTVDGLPYEFDCAVDFSRPTWVIGYSGKQVVNTIIDICPGGSNADNYLLEGTEKTGEAQRVFMDYSIENYDTDDWTALTFFDMPTATSLPSGEDGGGRVPWPFRYMIPDGKTKTFEDIRPGIEDRDKCTQEDGIQYGQDFLIFVKLKDCQTSANNGWWQLRGASWLQSDKGKDKGLFDALGSWEWHVKTDTLGIRIYIPRNETASGQYWPCIDEIIVPVCITTPYRRMAAKRYDITTGSYDDVADGTEYNFDASDNAVVEIADDIVFLSDVRGVDIETVYRTSVPSLLTAEIIEPRDDLLKFAGSKLRELRKTDGTAVTVRVPTSMYINLSDQYPKNLGDVLGNITNADAAGIQPQPLPRPLVLRNIEIGMVDTVLKFS